MVLILRHLLDQFCILMQAKDKRIDFLPFTSPLSIAVLIAIYLYFVLKWGPKFMEHRKPYSIDRCLLMYNGAQVILNFALLAYSLYEINIVYEGKVNFMCESLDYSDSYVGIRSAQLSYCYLLLKILDLMDTIFFVLRKRTRQISFLHVYHHVAILLGSYIAVSWAPGGHPFFFGLLNCFVHFIMYGYYFGSVYNPELKKNIWLKKSITQMQILQFVLTIAHLSIPLFVGDCDYPKSMLVIGISQNLIMLLLFTDFYYTAYIKPKINKST